MSRLGVLPLVVCAACARREVSTLRYTSTDCPDPAGCSVTAADSSFESPHARGVERGAMPAPPPPSCASVAVALTALELGNYAADEADRETSLAKHELACRQARLDGRELACLSTVTDTLHVGYCTRKLGAPTVRVELVEVADCRWLIAEMQQVLANSHLARQVPAYEASCREDRWSVELAACLQSAVYDPRRTCDRLAPRWLFDRLDERVAQHH